MGRLHREDLVQVRGRRGHAKARRRRTPDGHVPSHGRGQGGGRGRRRGHGSAQAEQADLRLFRSRAATSDDGVVRRERSALELCQRRDAEGDDHTDDGRRHGPRARGERERRRQEGGVLGLERAGHRVGGFGRNIVKAGAEAADARTRRRRALRRGAPPGHHRERRFRRRRHRVERGQRRQATQADPAAAERSGCERVFFAGFPRGGVRTLHRGRRSAADFDERAERVQVNPGGAVRVSRGRARSHVERDTELGGAALRLSRRTRGRRERAVRRDRPKGDQDGHRRLRRPVPALGHRRPGAGDTLAQCAGRGRGRAAVWKVRRGTPRVLAGALEREVRQRGAMAGGGGHRRLLHHGGRRLRGAPVV